MDKNLKNVLNKRVELTIQNLKKNHMNAYYVQTSSEALNIIDTLVNDGDIVSVGGSMTLFETGAIDYLRKRDVKFLDRYAEGLDANDIVKIYQESFACDAYFTSSNAITENGELYNVDGRGNRVAAMIWGPKKVIVLAGINKIVKDIDEAVDRNKRIAAPANVQRLSKNTPCFTTGYCTNCNSPDKICNAYSVINGQGDPDRMHIIFIDGNYGY